MDSDKIREILQNVFKNANPLQLLLIQNHIYGCFVLLEDIAQNTLEISDNSILYPDYVFNFDTSFNYIGIKSGFVSDNNLTLESYSNEYKQFWLEQFKAADLLHDISEVDTLEDIIIDYIRDNIPENDAYFINALSTGVLSEEWIKKLLRLLEESPDCNSECSIKENIMIHAAEAEKVIKSHNRHKTRRRHQKRSTPIVRKKLLNITRRKHI